MRVLVLVATVLALAGAAGTVFTEPATAHETADVQGYDFDVGWGQEPAFAGELNSVQLTVTSSGDGKPVKDLGDEFRVIVVYGENELELPLSPSTYGAPGEFRAWFVPTAPGDYTFRFTGTLGGRKIDESFTSSPKTFDSVQDPVKLQFPVQTGTLGQLARRLDAEEPRKTALDPASEEGSGAGTLGVVGIVVGGLGLAVAGLALARTRA